MIINPSHVQLDFEFLLNIAAFIKRIKQNKNNILIVKLKKYIRNPDQITLKRK